MSVNRQDYGRCSMIRFFHRLLNPHCPECAVCVTCEALKAQVASLLHEKERLLDALLEKQKPDIVSPVHAEPIKPRFIPWSVRRQLLEEREKKRMETEKLEEEVLDSSV
ncbi:MAG: hypothetical protein QXE45_04490 [Thermoplasmata archaeon]